MSKKSKINIKTEKELKVMEEGGQHLANIKKELEESIKSGTTAQEIDELAEKLIGVVDGKPSFKMVPDYDWATCINVNEGLVHGIPKDAVRFKKGDLVSVDVGMFYKDFHTDTSITKGIEIDEDQKDFLNTGKKALEEAIRQTVSGNRVYHISQAIETTLQKDNLTPIRALVGHGIGRKLHEDPQVPCFTEGDKEWTPMLKEGMVLAIEVMYTRGDSEVVQEADGWTIKVKNGNISALFEETVAVTSKGPQVLTR